MGFPRIRDLIPCSQSVSKAAAGPLSQQLSTCFELNPKATEVKYRCCLAQNITSCSDDLRGGPRCPPPPRGAAWEPIHLFGE
jgi:hypothetical protein